MTATEIFNLIPKSWSGFTLKQYLRTLTITEDPSLMTDVQNIEQGSQLIAALSGVDKSVIDQVTYKDFLWLQSCLKWMAEKPADNPDVEKLYKGVDDITLDEYILYQNYQVNPIEVLPILISTLRKEKVSKEETLKLSMSEVIPAVFFCLAQLKQLIESTVKHYSEKINQQNQLENLKHGMMTDKQ